MEVSALDWSDRSTYQFPSLTSTTGLIDINSDENSVQLSKLSTDKSNTRIEYTRERQERSHSETWAVGVEEAGGCRPDWDLVIGADVVWLEDLVPLLVGALSILCGPHTELLLSHQKRSEHTDRILFNSLEKYFYIQEVSQSVSQSVTILSWHCDDQLVIQSIDQE